MIEFQEGMTLVVGSKEWLDLLLMLFKRQHFLNACQLIKVHLLLSCGIYGGVTIIIVSSIIPADIFTFIIINYMMP